MNYDLSNNPLINKIFAKHRVVLAFIFGSTVKGKITKLSDLDIAVFLDKKVKPNKYQQIRLSLLDELGKIIKDKPLDIIVLNDCSPLLAQMAITKGKVIYCPNENLKVDLQVQSLKNEEFTKFAFYFLKFLEKE